MADIEAPSPDGKPKSNFSIGGSLSKSVGPLPVWGWGAAILIAVGIIIIRRRSQSSSVPGETTYAQQAQIPTVGGSAGRDVSPVVTGGEPAITSNNAWRAAAVRTLLAKGYSALAIDDAIAKYLRGDRLSSQDQALVDMALGALGVPPQPPPVGGREPDTTTNATIPDDWKALGWRLGANGTWQWIGDDRPGVVAGGLYEYDPGTGDAWFSEGGKRTIYTPKGGKPVALK